MTVSMMWRAALGGLLAISLLLAGCSSTPKDEATSSKPRNCTQTPATTWPRAATTRRSRSSSAWKGRAAGTLLAQQAQLDLAYLHWRSGERTAALTALDRFIKLNPSSPALDYALYLRGHGQLQRQPGLSRQLCGQDLSERDQQASRDAYQAFKQLVDQFPNSSYSGRRAACA